MTAICPCGSGLEEENCCIAILLGKKSAQTALQLMRSRYTAFTRADIAYIKQTMLPPAANQFDFANANEWASTVTWLGLTILKSGEDGDEGYVEFIAKFEENSKVQQIHEHSIFKRKNGVWFYTDRKRLATPGRNDPCHCGSGKKYKKCCGNS